MAERSTTEAVRLVNAALAEATEIVLRMDTEHHWHSRRPRKGEDEEFKALNFELGTPEFERYAQYVRNQLRQEAEAMIRPPKNKDGKDVQPARPLLAVRFNPATKTVRLWPFEIKVGAEFHFEA